MKIIRPVSGRLNSRLTKCSEAYTDSLEANKMRHCLLERLYDAHMGTYSDKERAAKIIAIDKEGKAFMRQAEKICQKIKRCHILFLPETMICIQ